MSQERAGGHIMVANLGEAFDDFTKLDKKNYDRQRRLELSIEEQGFLWAGDNTLVITSGTPHPRYIAHLATALAIKNIQHIAPSIVSGRLSEDIAGDTDVLAAISNFVVASKEACMISAYSSTKSYRNLVADIKAAHPDIKSPELPLNEWIRDYADSKKGFRELATLLKGKLNIPQGVYCELPEFAQDVAKYFLTNGRSCILKPNIGEDGMGQEKLHPGTTPKVVRETIEANPYLRQGDLIVEELIQTGVSRISPSGEWICTDSGTEFQYSGAQLLSDIGATFEGFDIGPAVISENVDSQIRDAGASFGDLIQRLGYRGYFDIDFLISSGGDLIAVESNLRRTGATHVHMIGTRLGGKKYYENLYLRSSDVEQCVPKGLLVGDVFDRLEPIFYKFNVSDSGVIITLSSGINEGRLGYVAIGETPQKIVEIQHALRALLWAN